MTKADDTTANRTILICNCEDTMKPDGKTIGLGLDLGELRVHRNLCRAGLGEFERLAATGAPLCIACTQEAQVFGETLDEIEGASEQVRFVNIRERAGWSDEGANASPKMAALIAESLIEVPPARAVTLVSGGQVLVMGEDETALAAANRLAKHMHVIVVLTGAVPDAAPEGVGGMAVFKGTVKGGRGHLGDFTVDVQDCAPALPSARGAWTFDLASDRKLEADILLDLRKAPALFSAPEKRDGYFNPDPKDPTLVERALFDIADLVGEFEKPIFISFAKEKCAHSRSRITGCTRCIDLCPTGAITPDGDHVTIDPYTCAGCGSCAGVCPTGAASYAMPPDVALFQRLRALMTTYFKAGGKKPPHLLIYGIEHGTPILEAMARSGRGLPAHVLPFAVNEITQVGVEFLLTATAYGADRIAFLGHERRAQERAGLHTQMEYGEAVLTGLGYEGARFTVLDDMDPDNIGAALYDAAPIGDVKPAGFLAMGQKRGMLELALAHLHGVAPTAVDCVALPTGAPFGTIEVNAAECTLCLSCVSCCPTAALRDNPDKPQLSYQESACVQCGLCAATCPEKVITLAPRISFREDATRHRVIKEEEPFTCIRCGKAYGTKSTIEKMIGKLAAHPMFSEGRQLERLKMCDNCRVIDLAETETDPMAAAARPHPRTTDDYLREREELRKSAAEDAKAKGLLPDQE